MARQTGRRRAWIAFGLVAGIGAIAVGAWALDRWKPFADDPVAITWPENVAPLAEFVEHETGLQFLRPIHVVYLATDDAFQARANPPVEPTADDKTAAAADEALGRALGLWGDDLDFLAATTEAGPNAGNVGWDDRTRTLLLHSKGPGAELDVIDRSTVIILLTEELDDQHYDIGRRLAATETAQAFQALRAVHIGQAVWVRDQWVDHLGADDSTAYFQARRKADSDRATTNADLPFAFRSLRVAAQSVGISFVNAMHEVGRDDTATLAAVLGTDTPVATDQVSLPVSKYQRRDHLEPVQAPATPTGGTFVQERQLGPFGLFLLMAAGLPAQEALTAADGWGNDAVTVYELDGRICLDARIVADSRTDADRIERGLQNWGATRPDDAKALVARDGTSLLFSVCDPGDADQSIVPEAKIQQWFTRADVLGQQVDYLGLPDLAECSAVRFFEEFTASAWSGKNADFDQYSELDNLTDECVKSR